MKMLIIVHCGHHLRTWFQYFCKIRDLWGHNKTPCWLQGFIASPLELSFIHWLTPHLFWKIVTSMKMLIIVHCGHHLLTLFQYFCIIRDLWGHNETPCWLQGFMVSPLQLSFLHRPYHIFFEISDIYENADHSTVRTPFANIVRVLLFNQGPMWSQ